MIPQFTCWALGSGPFGLVVGTSWLVLLLAVIQERVYPFLANHLFLIEGRERERGTRCMYLLHSIAPSSTTPAQPSCCVGADCRTRGSTTFCAPRCWVTWKAVSTRGELEFCESPRSLILCCSSDVNPAVEKSHPVHLRQE